MNASATVSVMVQPSVTISLVPEVRGGPFIFSNSLEDSCRAAAAIGFPAEVEDKIAPIAEMEELIFERTGARPGESGGWFRLNPRVDDIPDRFSAEHRGVRLLQLGTVAKGGGGCMCPESSLLRALVTHLLIGREDVVVALLGEPLVVHGTGMQVRCFTHVDDIVEVNLMAARHGIMSGHAFNVTPGVQVRVIELAHEIIKLAGSGTIEHGPPNPTDVRDWRISDLRLSKLGMEWTPFEEGLAGTFTWYKEKYAGST